MTIAGPTSGIESSFGHSFFTFLLEESVYSKNGQNIKAPIWLASSVSAQNSELSKTFKFVQKIEGALGINSARMHLFNLKHFASSYFRDNRSLSFLELDLNIEQRRLIFKKILNQKTKPLGPYSFLTKNCSSYLKEILISSLKPSYYFNSLIWWGYAPLDLVLEIRKMGILKKLDEKFLSNVELEFGYTLQ